MKINLLLHNQSIRAGYVNIDPYATPGDSQRICSSVSNLDNVVEDAQAVEIIALDLIDFMPAMQRDDILDGWIKKLRHGGTITLGGIDIREVARAIVNQRLTPMEANLILYGDQKSPWAYRKSTLTIQQVLQFLQDHGLSIHRKEVVNYSYYVTARRP